MARILIIDDDDYVRRPLRKMLEVAGHDVVEAREGDEGLKLQRDQPCDLVITDLFMPGKEGLQTIRELRREFPGVKIIAMSGGGLDHDVDFLPYAQMVGALRTLAKPFERTDLLNAVAELLGPDAKSA